MSNKKKLDPSKTLMELVEEGWTLQEVMDAIGSQQLTRQKTEKRIPTWQNTDIIHDIGIPGI